MYIVLDCRNDNGIDIQALMEWLGIRYYRFSLYNHFLVWCLNVKKYVHFLMF